MLGIVCLLSLRYLLSPSCVGGGCLVLFLSCLVSVYAFSFAVSFVWSCLILGCWLSTDFSFLFFVCLAYCMVFVPCFLSLLLSVFSVFLLSPLRSCSLSLFVPSLSLSLSSSLSASEPHSIATELVIRVRAKKLGQNLATGIMLVFVIPRHSHSGWSLVRYECTLDGRSSFFLPPILIPQCHAGTGPTRGFS